MKSIHNPLNQVAQFMLIVLWIYAAFSKLLNYELSKNEMLNQVFPYPVALTLAWLIPAIEILTALLILMPKATYYGFWASLILLISFTLYIILGLFNLYPRMPCSCAGIIPELSWSKHLLINFFFLAITLIAIITNRRGKEKLA